MLYNKKRWHSMRYNARGRKALHHHKTMAVTGLSVTVTGKVAFKLNLSSAGIPFRHGLLTLERLPALTYGSRTSNR